MLRGRVLIGSDGRRSGTAERAKIKRTGWGYGQTALVCAIAHEKPHNGIAHQFFMPSGPLAILPLTGNRSSIVWSETEVKAKRIHALPDANYLDALRPAFGDFLGDIQLAGRAIYLPSEPHHREQLHRRAPRPHWRCGAWCSPDCRARAKRWIAGCCSIGGGDDPCPKAR